MRIPLKANDREVLGVLLDTWRKLPADDPRNVDFDKAAAMLQLDDAQRRLLKSAGASNLSGIAAVLSAAPDAERQNADAQRIGALHESPKKGRKIEQPPPDKIKLQVSSTDSAAIIATIGARLAGTAAPNR